MKVFILALGVLLIAGCTLDFEDPRNRDGGTYEHDAVPSEPGDPGDPGDQGGGNNPPGDPGDPGGPEGPGQSDSKGGGKSQGRGADKGSNGKGHTK